tara:strand:+ start:1755 stop:2048 length:294 start_codon:yes stop_codon:yes gene_type:complete
MLVPFNPKFGAGVTVTPNVASATATKGLDSKTICFSNLGTTTVFVKLGYAGITATAADYPVLAASQVTLGKDEQFDTVAYISPAGAGSLHIIQGEGF